MMQIPLEERPRERLVHYGVDALSNIELLAIILGSGTKGQSVLHLAENLLAHFGSLTNLLDASIVQLKRVKGIGDAKAIELKAVFALARRLLMQEQKEKVKIKSAKEAYMAFRDLFLGEKKEHLAVLLLDAKMVKIHREVIGIGILNEVLLHPREVFYPAIQYNAHSLIIAHNHPSGDPTPSSADLKLTKTLFECSKVLDIPLLDHLIIAGDRYTSLQKYTPEGRHESS